MKIFIYWSLLHDPQVASFNEQVVAKHRLAQQYQYFLDILEDLTVFSTDDPNDADYFFVPLFIAAWQFENTDPEQFKLISGACGFLSRGRHLLVGTGDFGQRYQSKYEMQGRTSRAYRDKYAWLDDRFILLALESTDDLHPQDIAFFPYAIEPLQPDPRISRSLLCSFKGALGYQDLAERHIRGMQLANHAALLNNEGLHVFSADDTTDLGRLTGRHLMQRSDFTLCPAGFGQWSYRLIESLLAGSIPVLLADAYRFPFGKTMQWDRYVMRFAESRLAELPALLKSIDRKTIEEYQRRILDDAALFQKEHCLELLCRTLEERVQGKSAEWVYPRMRSPSEMGIICVDITNKCDLACSNCTRLLENQDAFWEMSLENFRVACRSLRGYRGIIAVIGGNPCMHSRFAEIAAIFEEEVPDRSQRGIWTNNAFKHAALLEEKFGAFNLNPHGVERGVKSVLPIYERMVKSGAFRGGYYDTPSEHAPLLVAGKDVFEPEEMWERIAHCDINKNWSAAIVENKGKLRAYFCEVAASFDLARNEDHGLPVHAGWWSARMEAFKDQIAAFCPGCGAPARIQGTFDHEELDTYSDANADLALKAAQNKKRKIIRIAPEQIGRLGHKVTKYQKNAS
jgi:hypothetical protein